MSRRRNALLVHIKLLLLLTTTLSASLIRLPLPAEAAVQAQLTLEPNWGWSDSIIHVHGVNFSPNVQVTIRWQTLSFWTNSVSTNPQGVFDLWLNVPDGLATGNYVVSAIDPNGITASATFTLYAVFTNAGSFGIRSQKQTVQWNYDDHSLYLDVWKFYHNSQNNWYNVMVQNYGLYVVRLTYNGTTYVFDLAGGRFNAWPQPLQERVLPFAIQDPNHIQGKILLYNPANTVLLATIVMDVYTPRAADNYYTVIFNIISEVKLDDLAFYVVYNMDVYQPLNNWALYDKDMDVVYQYLGPSPGTTIPAQYKGYAGFSGVLPASTHHDVEIDYNKLQSMANYLRDYNFNFRDRDEVYADTFVNSGVGLQWIIGSTQAKDNVIIPVSFATSDSTEDAFKDNISKSKLAAYQLISGYPTIALTTTEASGSSIIGINGRGFMPYASVDLDFGGVQVCSFLADRAGAFQGNFIVPTSINGTYTIQATDKYGITSSASFEVTAPTLDWLLERLDTLNAVIVGLSRDVNGNLIALINTNSGNILAKLNEIHATITSLIVNSKGETLAKIDTAVGTVTAKLSDINAQLIELKGNVITIKTDVGTIKTGLASINGTITTIEGRTATIQTDIGRIKTDIANMTQYLRDINASLQFVNATTLRIESQVGSLNVTVTDINKFLVEIEAKIATAENTTIGAYLALDTELGKIELQLNLLNATLVAIKGDAAEILVMIGQSTNTVFVELSSLKANITNIKQDTATIQTSIGTITTSIDNIHSEIIGVKGDIVTIKTNIGELRVNISDINAKVTLLNENYAAIETSLGVLMGNVTSINGEFVTIKTELGTLTANLRPMRSEIIQPSTILALVEIAVISAIVYSIYIIRSRHKRLKSVIKV